MKIMIEAIKNIFRRDKAFWLRFVGLLIVCIGLSTFAISAHTLEVTATTKVSEHWRGAYDILVRPISSILEIEKKTGLVEGNYLGIPTEGITREQYNIIKNINNIEVAAPVATIGFLQNNTGIIRLELKGNLDTLYRSEVTIINPNLKALYKDEGYFMVHSFGEAFVLDIKSFGYEEITEGKTRTDANLTQLPVLWTLVAGIDPNEEAKLVDLDLVTKTDPNEEAKAKLFGKYNVYSGEYLPTDEELKKGEDWEFQRKATVIPILVSKNAFLDLRCLVKVESVKLTQKEVKLLIDYELAIKNAKSREEYNRIRGKIETLLHSLSYHELVLDQEIVLDDYVHPMGGEALTFRPNQEVEGSRTIGGWSSISRNVMLYPGQVKYELASHPEPRGKELTLKANVQGFWGEDVNPQIEKFIPEAWWYRPPIDVPNDAPIFRPLAAYEPPPFMFEVKGIYDFEKLQVKQDPLSYVPIGIYEPPLATLKYDDEGKPVTPIQLDPDLNPAGFIPRPPLALTTLEAAEFFRGENFIDAIRVRVKGITEYTPENVEKVEKVAREIVEKTNLHVDIVAGSSPQKVLVHVPNLGYVEERWTTLGTAAKITSGINLANITLLSCLLVTSALYISGIAQLSILSRRREIGLLKAVGWRTKTLLTHLLVEALVLGILSALITTLTSFTMIRLFALEPSWLVLTIIFLAAPALYIFSTLYPAYQETYKYPAYSLSWGEIKPFKKRMKTSLSIISLATKNLLRKLTRSIICILTIAFSIGLAVVLVSILKELGGILRVTLLGEFIAFSIRPYHVIMIITALVMAILTILENLLFGVMERKREFGLLKAIGWHTTHLIVCVILEGIIIGTIGGLLGGGVGSLLFWALSGKLSINILIVGLLGTISAIFLSLLASLYPARQAALFTPAESLAGPESRRSVPKIRHTALRWALALGLIVIFLLGLALIGGRPEKLHETIEIITTKKTPPHPAERAVSGKKAINYVKTLVDLGPRFSGNETQKKAADFIEKRLRSYGLNVEREIFPLREVKFYKQDGSPIDVPGNIDLEDLHIKGVAVNFKDLKANEPISGKVHFIKSDKLLPKPSELVDKIVIVEEEDFDDEGNPNRALREFIALYKNNYTFKAAVSIFIWPEQKPDFEELLKKEEIIAKIPIAENIITTIKGKERPEKEILVVAHYDTNSRCPGADEGGSGIGVFLELARVFSKSKAPVTLRFIAFAGTESGLEGSIAYLLNNDIEPENIIAAIEFNRVGAFDKLLVGHDLDAANLEELMLDKEILRKERQIGQFVIKANWVRTINLGDVNIIDRINKLLKGSCGLGESPDKLIEKAIDVTEKLDCQAESSYYPCIGDYYAFLYKEIPAIILCGEGNMLAGSPYDTIENIKESSLDKAAALGYQLILELGSDLK
jgi:hypothetical protein